MIAEDALRRAKPSKARRADHEGRRAAAAFKTVDER